MAADRPRFAVGSVHIAARPISNCATCADTLELKYPGRVYTGRSIQSAKVFGVTFTAPNVLTFLRIATVPVLVYLLTFPGPIPSAIAAGVFFLATITDFLDGYIARSYGSGTNLGKFLEPLADKLLVTAVLIMLAAMPRMPRIPAWMVVVLVSREILVT